MTETETNAPTAPGQEDKVPEKDKGPLIQLPPGFEVMCLFETASTQWNVRVPVGVTREDMLFPSFWAHHANAKRPGDEIRALADDGTWRATYLVVDSAKTWLKVKELTYIELSGKESEENALLVKAFIGEHNVVHRGPRKWSVLRTADGAVLTEDIQEKDAAYAWLDKHARSQVSGAVKAA